MESQSAFVKNTLLCTSVPFCLLFIVSMMVVLKLNIETRLFN